MAAALLASFGFAVYQTLNRRALASIDVYRGTAIVLAVGTLVLTLVAVTTTDVGLLGRAGLYPLACFAVAGVVHFTGGWTLLGLSQVRLGTARTGVVVGTVPMFGAIVAATFLDEPLNARMGAGLVVLMAGVAVVSSTGGASASVGPRDVRRGLAAGTGAALCWSLSPVLIRAGLAAVPSPVIGAAVGMAFATLVYLALLVAVPDRRGQAGGGGASVRLLVYAGTAVSLAIWLQWTAFALVPVAIALAVIQLTPLLVVLLALRFGGDPLRPADLRRIVVGAVVTVLGAAAVVVAS